MGEQNVRPDPRWRSGRGRLELHPGGQAFLVEDEHVQRLGRVLVEGVDDGEGRRLVGEQCTNPSSGSEAGAYGWSGWAFQASRETTW